MWGLSGGRKDRESWRVAGLKMTRSGPAREDGGSETQRY